VLITYLHGFKTGKVNQDTKFYFPVFDPAVKLKIRVKKVKQSRYRPGVAQRVPGSKVKQSHYRPGVAQRVPGS
jgi:hypothetical protein